MPSSDKECEAAPKALLYSFVHPLIKKKKETAVASAAPQLTRDQGKKKESSRMHIRGAFREFSQEIDPKKGTRFRVTLLREGLGNFNDCFYYTADAIRSAVPVFEGAQFYIDHPSESEEMDRPERSTKDLSGYFENLSATAGPDGSFTLDGDLVIPVDPVFDRERAQIKESIDYSQKHPGKDLVGLSINADGDFETVAIDQFFKQGPIPASCKDKLVEAMAKGITMIRPVRQMTSAFSCDLVTTAGAGGKVNQMLEQEKKMEKHESHEHEEKKEGSGGVDPAGPDASSDSHGDHADAAEDEQLIKKMLDKYLGKPDHTEDDHQMAKEAMKHAMEMGMEGDEAMKCAGYNMKMAKHMQSKQTESGDAKDQPEQKPKPKAVGDAGHVPSADQHSESEHDEKKEGQKESARGNTMVKMAAEIARLTQKLNSMELKEHVDLALKESKLPSSATKKFRECIKDVKTTKEVDQKLEMFKEAFSLGGRPEDSFILGVEKSGSFSEAAGFADCADNE